MVAVDSTAVADFLTAAAAGPSALIVEGEAGIGKTTLWLAAVAAARERGFRVLSAQPAAAESVLAYASLADLLSEVDTALLADLPEPQRLALDQVLLHTASHSPATDPRTAAAAFLSIIGRCSQDTPLLLAIDDLQWLDPSSVRVLSFAARRLSGRIGVLGAARTGPANVTSVSWLQLPRPDSLRWIRVPPLSLGSLHAVVSKRLNRTFARPTMLRIQQISGGNPFYAIELARSMRADATIPESALPDTLAELMKARIDGLDTDVQSVLLAAACAAAPTVDLVAQVTGGSAGHVVALLEAAEHAGIIEITGHRLRFVHPLLAQGVYTTAGPARRRSMHQRLADVVEEPELQARHLALATTTRDAATLRSLDVAAEIARRRGAPAAAADLLNLAVGLGGDTPERRIRLANHHFDAGDVETARTVLEHVIEELSPSSLRAEALSLLARVRLSDDSLPEAHHFLARAMGEVGSNLALRTQILSMMSFCSLLLGDLTGALRSADDALGRAESLGEPQLVSQALSMRVMLGTLNGEGVDEPSLRRALELEDRDAYAYIFVRPSFHLALILAWTGQLEQARREVLASRARCLERGEDAEVVVVAFNYVALGAWLGDFADAAVVAEDAMERALQAGGDQMLMCAHTMRAELAAYAGRVDEARRTVGAALAASRRSGAGFMASWQLAILGFVEVSLGRHEAALTTLAPLLVALMASPDATEIRVASFVPDAVESFVALGRPDDAEPLIVALERNGQRLDRAWMLAVGARCRAMVLSATGDLEAANAAVQQAMTEHERLPMPFERARTQLFAGQLQRRLRQKDAASATLREALATFEALGTPLWADRARTALDRSNVGPKVMAGLTPSEQRVAELAAAGMTNRDAAAALFISPKTVEANLSRIYHKLGIHSRAELGRRIGQADGGST